MGKRTDHIDRELSSWPDVKYDFHEGGKKHNRLNLSYNGQDRFVVYSKSASDHRAFTNQIADVRRACRALGAQRAGQEA
jgi:hypothetical protein